MSLALIGGTGVSTLPGLTVIRSHAVDTPFGSCSAPVEEGRLDGSTLFFLHRHGGAAGAIAPHLINYRANLWALQHLGVRRVIGINAVGAIAPRLRPGKLVVPDQLIDYSWGREHTFDEGGSGSLQHIDFTAPYAAPLRAALLDAARSGGVPCADTATLAVTQGPRLETAAEVRRLARDGCDIVGMTGMPEAALARELGMQYAALCMIVNAAAGVGAAPIDLAEIQRVLARERELLARVLALAVPALCDEDAAPGGTR